MSKKNFLNNLKRIIVKNKFEIVFLILLFIFSTFLRFSDLGYSHYYGDETKTLYLRKDVPASDFLFNQRKGPVQFFATWSMEKIIGNYDEGVMRFPFALVGLFAVFVLYALMRIMFNKPAAMFSAFLYSINGFYIAFSRTAQYQSFLLLFGLLGLFFIVLSLKFKEKYKLFYVLSGLFYGLAVLTHYDALFFLMPGLILMFWNDSKVKLVKVLYFLVPFITITSAFYIPYIVQGFFANHTTGYIAGRIFTGDYQTNYSLYTYFVYNGVFFSLLPFLFALPVLFKFNNSQPFKNEYLYALLFWFLVPATLFLVVFLNPGTHIHNFFLPLILFSGVGFAYLYSVTNKKLLLTFVFLVFTVLSVISAYFYVPALNTGYPWKNSEIGPFKVAQVNDSYHLFLYGFPYNRGWDEVRDYFEENGMPRSFYTNDNVTIGQYYLQGVPVHIPHPEKMPEYYIYIKNNQMFNNEFVYRNIYKLEKHSKDYRIYRLIK